MSTSCCSECLKEIEGMEIFAHPRHADVDVCFDCHEAIVQEQEEREELATIRSQMPTIDKLARQSGVASPKDFKGNCHFASLQLVLLLPDAWKAKVVRGHWCGGSQHSWVEIRLPQSGDPYILDPTQWVFVGGPPAIAVERDIDIRYDKNSYKLRSAMRRALKLKMPKRGSEVVASGLSAQAQDFLTASYGRSWAVWSVAEAHYIATTPPNELAGCAADIHLALERCGWRAFIPIDWRNVSVSALAAPIKASGVWSREK